MELEHWVPTLLGFNGQHRIADGQSKARLLEFPTRPAFHLTNIDVVFFPFTAGQQDASSDPLWRPFLGPSGLQQRF